MSNSHLSTQIKNKNQNLLGIHLILHKISQCNIKIQTMNLKTEKREKLYMRMVSKLNHTEDS